MVVKAHVHKSTEKMNGKDPLNRELFIFKNVTEKKTMHNP